MPTNISRIRINASTEKVWEALTDPEQVKQWQYGSILLTDWQEGGEIRFRNEWEGQVFEQWGKVLEIIPHELIRYSLFAPRPGLEDKPENYFIMSYILSEEGGSTLLRIEQEDNRPGATQEVRESEEDEQSVLGMLKKLVEAT
ncbi:SRPBCC family protein [Paenibacillus sp. VCA1]|uniref:SRPBCC family protein n=1 Tax=Paenibacillus sp. VCA1 TaxID=3039148 RepID=UPI0028710282|nr:SRPBCC family protein [Paenibacillus sp. VCA1]MDR9854964.1 SRPBCC family protein [Paenibacillus sp. VCA1]